MDLWDIAYGNGVFVAVGDEPAPPVPPYLSFPGEIGARYRLQATSVLPATEWLTLQTFTNTRPITLLLDPTITNSPQRFYRVVWP